jgi:hypothetical protein
MFKKFFVSRKEFDGLQQRLSVLEVKERGRQDQEDKKEAELESAQKHVEALIEGSMNQPDETTSEKSPAAQSSLSNPLSSFNNEDWKIIKQAVVTKEDSSWYEPTPKVKPRKVGRVHKINKVRK